jgi:hypothetical protein
MQLEHCVEEVGDWACAMGHCGGCDIGGCDTGELS